MEVHDTNRRLLLEGNDRSITVCDAADCYEAATAEVEVSVGKFGVLTLNLCHGCAVNKFGAKKVE